VTGGHSGKEQGCGYEDDRSGKRPANTRLGWHGQSTSGLNHQDGTSLQRTPTRGPASRAETIDDLQARPVRPIIRDVEGVVKS